MSIWEVIESGVAALLWAAIFLFGSSARRIPALIYERRDVTSFGAGMSVVYAFVHMMPESHEVRRTFAGSVAVRLPYEGMVTYFVALTGFISFCGMKRHQRDQREKNLG